MNFDLSEEQTMLKEALGRFLAQQYGFERRRALAREKEGWSRGVWRWLADQGYLGLPFAEADGGLGGGPIEMMVIAEALGARLAAEPYFASIVLGGTALRLSQNADLRVALVPRIAAGEVTLAFAHDESGARSLAARRRVKAIREAGQWRLSGTKDPVIHGASADRLIVTAEAAEGLGVFLLKASTMGVARRGYATFDGLRAAEVRFEGAIAHDADMLALGAEAEALVERALQHGIAFLAAEAVGLMRMLIELTVEHLNTRKQFGRPLADFQALRHRAVEMLIATEQAESAKIYGAMTTDEPDDLERRKAFAAVKAVTGSAARTVGQSAIQLHGGIGVTDEHCVGWAMRRLTMIEMMLGDTEHHIAALADLGGFLAAAE